MAFRIETIHAFIAPDPINGDEGVVAWMTPTDRMWMPLIAADPARLKELRPLAEEVARITGRKIKLVRFEARVEVEEL